MPRAAGVPWGRGARCRGRSRLPWAGGALPPCPSAEPGRSPQEGSPTGAEADAPWGMPSSSCRSRSSAATNLNRRTYDLEGESPKPTGLGQNTGWRGEQGPRCAGDGHGVP